MTRWKYHFSRILLNTGLIRGCDLSLPSVIFNKEYHNLLIFDYTKILSLHQPVIAWLDQHSIAYRVKLQEQTIVLKDAETKKWVLENLVATIYTRFLVKAKYVRAFEEWCDDNNIGFIKVGSGSYVDEFRLVGLESFILAKIRFNIRINEYKDHYVEFD